MPVRRILGSRTTTYDQRGWVTVKNVTGAPTYYTYDAAGNVVQMRDAKLNPTSDGFFLYARTLDRQAQQMPIPVPSPWKTMPSIGEGSSAS